MLLKKLLKVEKILGRNRKTKKGYQNRIIDLDILFFGDKIMSTKDLKIPHSKLHLRNFILIPLIELVPKLIHPILKHNINELYQICPDNSNVSKVNVDLSKRFNGDTNVSADYTGDNVDARIDTKGFEIGRTFGDKDNNVNINLAQDFDGDTSVNVEGIKQLNKYLKARGFANTSGNYGASLGFDIPL